MRTLQVDAARGFRGGERQVLALARGLIERGHPTCVIGRPQSTLVERAAEMGIDVASLPQRGGWDAWSGIRLALRARAFRADLLHVHDAHSLTVGALASRFAGVPLVLSRRVDFVPTAMGRWCYRRCPHLVLAVSRRVEDVMRAAGVSQSRLRVVYDGVDVAGIASAGSPEALLREIGLSPAGLYIGNVASLTDHKGQRYLIEAAPRVLERVPEAMFVIAGEGELREDLERLIRARRLEGKVVLLGFVPEVHRLYRAMAVFVMSSHLEGLGSAVLEAMAAGTPVVVTRAGGLPEIVENEIHGLVVPPKDPEALARGILRLLEDRSFATRCGEEAKRHVFASFTVDHMVERTLEAYVDLVDPDRSVE